MNKELHGIDKQQCRIAFNKAAQHYDEVAVLQREVGSRMLDRLDLIKLKPNIVVDIGAGTGVCTQALGKRYSQAKVVALDIATAMLQQAKHKRHWLSKPFSHKYYYVCGDAEHLPLADNSVDLLFSNMTIQWCADLDQTFAEFRRVLKHGGTLLFSTMGPDTLRELRSSWTHADDFTHVHTFIDMHDIGDALMRNGFADPVMDVENFTLTYATAEQLMRELKVLGAHNVSPSRTPGLTGKMRLQTMLAAYEKYRHDGLLPATYEVVYGHAWNLESQSPENVHRVNVAPPSRVAPSSQVAPPNKVAPPNIK